MKLKIATSISHYVWFLTLQRIIFGRKLALKKSTNTQVYTTVKF